MSTMGPKTKASIEAIVAALREFPRDHHRQLLEWADLIATEQFTVEEIAHGGVTWSRAGTRHEMAYPNYNPDWSK